MKRRKAIKSAAAMMAVALSAGTISSIVSGCQVDTTEDWSPQFLSAEEVKLVSHVTERILPRTDSPGANDVLVHRFIDNAVKLNFTAEEQKQFVSGLAIFDDKCREIFDKIFIKCSPDNQDIVLTAISAEASEFKSNAPGPEHIFPLLKGMAIMGYFTSEKVAREVLVYDPIPGEYTGCIEYSEVNGTWAL